MNQRLRELSSARFLLGCATLATCACLSMVTSVNAVVITDDFNTSHDYVFGDTTGTIWTGMENIPFLQGQTLFDANTTRPGVLSVGDNGTFDADDNPNNGVSGMGWEGGRSTAPFLHTTVPAGKDFTTTVTISTQSVGTWSMAGAIMRVGNSPTPPGVGANHSDENFVTFGSFRTDAANIDEGNTLNKRIENGVEMSDNNIAINAAGTEPLPLRLRLERVGGGITYRGWVSTDGGATYQFQSRVNPTAGSALADPTVPLEVGLGYMNFGTFAGTAEFDDFVLDYYDPLPAPGAPSITTAATDLTVPQGKVIEQLLSDTTGQGGPFSWVRTPNLPGTDAMILGTQGGTSALLPNPPLDTSYFRWDTAGVPNGVYVVTVNATNDWGEASNSIVLSVTVIPEPSTIAIIGLAMAGVLRAIRRRRTYTK